MLRLLSPAVEEIAAAAHWFEDQAQGLGEEFWRLVDHQFSLIEQNPHRFGKSDFATEKIDLRYAYVERFRYVIHFAIERNELVVVAVSHASRRPGYWLTRVKG